MEQSLQLRWLRLARNEVAKQEVIEKGRGRGRDVHFRGIGDQVVTSLIKLPVAGALGGQDVPYARSITGGSTPPPVGNDHLLPWG